MNRKTILTETANKGDRQNVLFGSTFMGRVYQTVCTDIQDFDKKSPITDSSYFNDFHFWRIIFWKYVVPHVIFY